MTGWDALLRGFSEPEFTPDEAAWLPRLEPWTEPALPIQDREQPLIPPAGCPGACLEGECSAPTTFYGCGGCCGCMGGCVALYEQRQTAPHVWTGDSA